MTDRRITKFLTAAAAIAVGGITIAAATPVPDTAGLYTPAPAAVPTTGISLPLGKCVNMGNHLEAPNEGDWGRKIADSDFTNIKQAGFSTIRLPVRFAGHAQEAAPYTIDPAFMARVHHVVSTATAAGLNVILDLHNYDALMTDPAGNSARLAGLWKQVAASFASAPDTVWFEIINEPHDKFDNANLLATVSPSLAAIRATNPKRPVIIGGGHWSGIDSLATLQLPDDPYVVPTFHYYDPFPFTHQGAKWVKPTPPPIGATFGSKKDITELNASLDKVKAYMKRTGRVPFVGEFGAIDIPQMPVAQRINYYATVSAAYASIGVQSCAWAYTNTFPLYKKDHWIPGMVRAIRTTKTL